jgi:hypothetical protein
MFPRRFVLKETTAIGDYRREVLWALSSHEQIREAIEWISVDLT